LADAFIRFKPNFLIAKKNNKKVYHNYRLGIFVLLDSTTRMLPIPLMIKANIAKFCFLR